ncbi:MAG: thiamine pyrophosphate-dependent dehydrogenase E1 component subunit alpha [Acetobacteraceae bacterium]|nr:thiamine pyrophosphate-dependent dehydrogenase E1 component subunit alpha [Acetobacteraceae bacterium]
MTAPTSRATTSPTGGIDGRALYRDMVRIRYFEDEIERLWKTGDIPGTIHLYQGQEAVAVGVCAALTAEDSVAATYRGHGVCLARGIDPESLFAELLGRGSGICGGRAGTMNVASLSQGVMGCYGIVGGSIGAATGAALAAQLRGTRMVATAFFGDGAANQAYFHECLNWASVRRLPVVYVCENNLYGEFTPMARVTAGGRIVSRASAYDIVGAEVDGNDVLAILDAARQAVSRARDGRGPTLLECKTYRHKGHSRGDPGTYRPKEEIAAWLERDPLPRHAQRIGSEAAEEIRREVRAELDEALQAALAAPYPDPELPAAATKEAV